MPKTMESLRSIVFRVVGKECGRGEQALTDGSTLKSVNLIGYGQRIAGIIAREAGKARVPTISDGNNLLDIVAIFEQVPDAE